MTDGRSLRNEYAFTTSRETSPAMWLALTLWLFYATSNQTDNRSSFLEQLMTQGPGPPAHTHPKAIEGFYVLEGVIDFHVGGATVAAGAGTLVHLPRLAEHTFTVKTPEARVLNFYAPAGLELQIMTLARPADERRRPTMEEGPPPSDPQLTSALSELYGTEAVTATPFLDPPDEENMKTSTRPTIGSVHIATAEDAARFDAFGCDWTRLAASSDTDENYDLFDVVVPPGTAMPARLLGADEALYVTEGELEITCEGSDGRAGAGSFTYARAGSILSWRAEAQQARLLAFHFPGGFDRALSRADGDDGLLAAELEASGTRFVDP